MTLKLYRHNFDVTAYYSGTNRIVRTLLSVAVAFFGVKILPLSAAALTFAFFAILIAMIIIGDFYLRRLYPDWPWSSRFIGKINFSEKTIEVVEGEKGNLMQLSDIAELIIFFDHYTGFCEPKGLDRNGNALLYIKTKSGDVQNFKFNVRTKLEFEEFTVLIECYKTSVPYFKAARPGDIQYVLKKDLSGRREYN